jgi:hypothetical protein
METIVQEVLFLFLFFSLKKESELIFVVSLDRVQVGLLKFSYITTEIRCNFKVWWIKETWHGSEASSSCLRSHLPSTLRHLDQKNLYNQEFTTVVRTFKNSFRIKRWNKQEEATELDVSEIQNILANSWWIPTEYIKRKVAELLNSLLTIRLKKRKVTYNNVRTGWRTCDTRKSLCYMPVNIWDSILIVSCQESQHIQLVWMHYRRLHPTSWEDLLRW